MATCTPPGALTLAGVSIHQLLTPDLHRDGPPVQPPARAGRPHQLRLVRSPGLGLLHLRGAEQCPSALGSRSPQPEPAAGHLPLCAHLRHGRQVVGDRASVSLHISWMGQSPKAWLGGGCWAVQVLAGRKLGRGPSAPGICRCRGTTCWGHSTPCPCWCSCHSFRAQAS